MPTHDEYARFLREYAALSEDQQALFAKAVKKLVRDLRASAGIRPSLRVKRVQGTTGIFEISWSGDGRATFEYGPEQIVGEPHIIWRRIGGHDILDQP
jgi:hypothetical protein